MAFLLADLRKKGGLPKAKSKAKAKAGAQANAKDNPDLDATVSDSAHVTGGRRFVGKQTPTSLSLPTPSVSTSSSSQAQKAQSIREGQPDSAPRGHYDILKLSRKASVAEIRNSYRRTALMTHPDKGGNVDAFREATQAFEVLSDQAQRQHYDAELERTRNSDGLSDLHICLTPEEAETDALLEALSDSRSARQVLRRWMAAKKSQRSGILKETSRKLLIIIQKWLEDPKYLLPHLLGDRKIVERKVEGRTMGCIHRDPRGEYCVELHFENMRFRCTRTFVLAEAVDWSISMTQLKATAFARLQASRSENLPVDSERLWPLTEEEVESAYRASPTMRLTFQAVYGQKQFRIISPSTQNVTLAMQIRLRFDQLFEDHREKKLQQKINASSKDIDRSMSKRLQDLKQETTRQVAVDKYEREVLEQALVTGIIKEVASRSSTVEDDIIKRQALLNEQATAALRVRDALGLDHHAAKRAVLALRKMSPDKLKRARAMLMGRLRPSLLDNASSPSASAGKRRRIDKKTSSVTPASAARIQSKATSSSSSTMPMSPRITNPVSPRMSPRTAQPMSPRTAVPMSPRTAMPMSPRITTADEEEEESLPLPSSLCSPLLPAAQLGGNPRAVIRATLTHAVFPDWCTLRATAASIRRCADEEFRRRFEDFIYNDNLFQWENRSLYTGRARPTPTSRLASRLTRFLAAPRHLAIFAHLDLGMAPMDALQDDRLTKALGKMSRLEDVVFPNQGWASGSERGRFLAALPAGTSAWGRGPA